MIMGPSLHCINLCFFFVRMYHTGNADLSDGEDDELLPLDTEVGTTDDDQESQVDDDQENQVDDDQEIQLDDDQEIQLDDDQENQVMMIRLKIRLMLLPLLQPQQLQQVWRRRIDLSLDLITNLLEEKTSLSFEKK